MKRKVFSFVVALALCLNLCPTWAFATEGNGFMTLDGNRSYATPYTFENSSMVINTNTYTLTGTNSDENSGAILVTSGQTLELNGPGAVVSQHGIGIKVESGGTLRITDPAPNISGYKYAISIASGANVTLAPGIYSGELGAIHVEDDVFDYSSLLPQGYTFFDESGNPISPDNLAEAEKITVGPCTEHTSRTYTHNPGTPTHTWSCTACKTTGSEPCTFTFNENGAGSCSQCHSGLAINVNPDDLSNLVYDGTLQPEEVEVTVTLTNSDGSTTQLARSTAGTQDGDFTVDIVSIKDAGEATVTVTGVTFNGTFVKTYTVEQATPGISWDNTTFSVDYDGSAITAGELPQINITINTPTGEDLHPFLKYQYQKNGDTGFTDGLPTNAGTYKVKAYLEVSQNYEAAETDPLLTLTINPISPIVTPPAAKTLTYNRTAQELVTAGELNPVAKKDGLEIQFATAQGGPWFASIPTATDAGDYTVWYQVTGLTDNYIAPDPNPAQVTGVSIQRKAIKPVVTLSQYSYLYDSGYHEPTVTVIDDEDGHYVINPLDNEYTVEYVNNRNVSTDDKPAKVVVTDSDPDGGNYTLEKVEVEFKITSKTQDTLSITNKPDTFTYGDKFTLQTSGGSGNGDVTWEIVSGQAEVGESSGQVVITGHGDITVKATKSGKDPATNVVNYENTTATWTFTADKKPVTATVTAEDKDYDGDNIATVHAEVKNGVLAGDEITITGLTGAFDNANAGVGKTVTVVTTGAAITGKNSEHYAVTYSATTVTATINKAIAKIMTAPVPASLTYNGTAQALIGTAAVVDPADVPVEYALSKDGPYSTNIPKGTNAGTYTVWYRVKETPNYTGLAPASVNVTIAKKPVNPTIELSGDGLQTDSTNTPPTYSYIYDGTAKKPVVTLKEADGTTIIPVGEYTVAYSNNINVGTATVTVTAKTDGNFSFENAPVTATFTINKEQAKVLTAPEAAGLPLTFNTFAQRLVTAGVASGGTMVYSTDGENGSYYEAIPTKTDAAEYTVHYKVQGDDNHSDSDVGSVKVTIAPKRVDNPTIELLDGTNPLVSYTYDGTAKKPNVVVKDGNTVIGANEYETRYDNNIDAGNTAAVNIIGKSGGNYDVTGSKTFVILKADIVFNPAPSAATLTYNGTAQELLVPGTTTGGTVLYALNSATSTYSDAIPTGVNAGTYSVYYKVAGDKNHNDLPAQGPVAVTIGRKPLTTPTIELTPNRFQYDGAVHLPTVTVKDGDTVLPASEYAWACDNNAPTQGGTYTITISDKTGGNYDLTGVVAPNNAKTFTIDKAAQAKLVIEGKPAVTNYGDSFTLTTSGGSGNGGLTWDVIDGNASIDTDGNVTIIGVGEVTVKVEKAADTNFEAAQAQLTFTAAPKPVTASVTVNNKPYDGTTAATVASASITTINSDTVTIDPASITAAFDDPHAGASKTVTLNTSKVKVTGVDAAKYAISYPATVTADITQATTTITTDPAAIASLTYNGQPQALITAGQTNVGFLVYSLSENGEYSTAIPTGTNAGTYSVYYKVDETTDYTGVAANTTPISVTIGPKSITPKIELSETSYKYDGTKKAPKVTLKDGDTVIPESQYDVTWAGTKSQTDADLLRIVDTYTATIKNVEGGNYTIDVTAAVDITPAEQAALHITGQPEHVYYGDTITTLGTTGGTGEGTVKWSVTSSGNNATIEANTGKLTITGTGAVTVRAERAVDNYGTVGDNWNFTVEPKLVTAEVTVTAKTYDGTTTIADTAITAQVKAADLVGGDTTVTLSGLTGVYTDANAGTGKTVTLNSTNATKATDDGKYAISYPTTAKGNINPKNVTVSISLSDHDLKIDNTVDPPVSYYEYDGTEKKPAVKVTADGGAVLKDSDYDVAYANNKNVSTATEKAAVTVTAKDGGNYTFTAAPVHFEIRKASAVLASSPQARNLTYEKGTAQELVTVGTASGGTVVYALKTGETEPTDASYSEAIPKGENAGTYTVYYMVKGDANHDDTTPQQMTATIKPKEITPTITLSQDSYEYDGTAHEPTVTVKDGTGDNEVTIPDTEYTVSYRDNVNAGTATVTVSNNNGGNYIVNGSVTFEITKADPTVTAPTGKPGLQYNGELQELVNAGVCHEGTVVYSVNGGNYSAAIPTASAVGTYTISWKVEGDANHSDTAPATLSVEIAKNTVNNPTIKLSQNQFTYNGNQQKPTVTVYDGNSRLIPEYEYTVTITPGKSTNTSNMVDVDIYTVTIAAVAKSNYEFQGTLTRTFEIVPADQETISITGTKAQVRYGDAIQLGVSGGTGDGAVTWKIEGNTDTALTQGGLLTVKDVNTSITVTATRSRGGNYTDVSTSWEFTAGKRPVTADVTVAAKNWDGTTSVSDTAITATVKRADLAFIGDSITITGLTGTYDSANVGTGKTVTLDKTNVNITGTNADKYDVTIPAATTGSILAVAATVATEPTANTLTYDAAQSQELVTAGTATGGTMVYSLDGKEFTPTIPKGKDAGTYTVYYKAQGDQNHTDSDAKTKDVTIGKQTVAAADLQIELSPPSAQYNGQVHHPDVTVRDGANNVIPASEYKVTYDTESGAKDWTAVGTYTVKVEDITGGNYVVDTATKDFIISTTAQAPLEIVNKPGQVYYGDSFTLSATGGSSSETVTWSSSDTSIADIDANGFVTIKGTGSATITATKAGGGNYDETKATYPLNAHKKPVTAIVTAENKEYDGNTTATIHITWRDGDLINGDTIQFSPDPTGTFDSDAVGTNKQVTVTANVVNNATAQKYDITIPSTTTASITKAVAAVPTLTANNRVYDGTTKDLVTGGDANTLYSASRDGVYSTTVPNGTNAGIYAVWYKEKGDANHNDSEPQSIQVTISPKTLTLAATDIELSGNDLQTDTDGTYYYAYDGTDKTPTVTIKDGAAVIPASEYTVTYSNNKNVTPDDKKATVTITDNQGGNYTVSGSATFEIRAGGAQLTSSPKANDLTYTGAAQQLVTVGTATGGHIEYQLTSAPTGEPTPSSDFSTSIPKGTNAGTYTVDYKVVGDDNHNDGPTGSVTVTIQPKTVISPKITVDGAPFTYNNDGTAHTPTVTIVDGTATIPAGEYTLSYQNNTNAGTATVIVTDNNGGNYTVNGTATFQIGKAAATVGTAPTGKTGLKYNGTAQELLNTLGTATGGTLVYSLSETGEYSAAIPTGKDVKEYEIWYKVLGDSNHSDSTATALSPKVKIDKNTVTNPTIQVTPASVKYTGEKQEPTITVKDDDGLLIDGSEYEVTYADTANGNNSDLIQVGTYTVTVTGKGTNYSFSKTATFTITPADQTALTITGTRERVYYGDTIQLGTTGGSSGGTVTWKVNDGAPASIDTNTGLLKITGVGSVTVTATSTDGNYKPQTATWNLYADKKPVTAVVTAKAKDYDGTEAATVTATLQDSDFVGTDSFTITLTGCTFEDANAGADKKVSVVSTNPTFAVNAGGTDNHENYAISYPATATASISKADIKSTDVTAPVAEDDTAKLVYTGQPLTLVKTAGTATGGTMEYSTDGTNYSASLPTGTDAGNYDVWYRVKGDGNHNDTAPVKLTETDKVTIAPQKVDADKLTIEFTPGSASYDGAVHKPSVTVKDNNNRVIPADEYTVAYSDTDWKTASSADVKHMVTITDKSGGNYEITEKGAEFTISIMGQNPLSIVGQPGEVRYGDSFTLSTTGGSGTGSVTWSSSDTSVATIGANGLVKTLKSGSTTITATKQADANYGAVSVTWALSVEKKPVTPIVTAKDKEYDGTDTATPVITWKDGDLVGSDTITLNLTGTFDNANVGDNKTVTITGTKPDSDKYDVTIPNTATASITPAAASVTAPTPLTVEYTGQPQPLVGAGVATHGTITYSLDGIVYGPNVPQGTSAGSYTVWYKVTGDANYKDIAPAVVPVTINPKTLTLTDANITLSPETFEYDGTPKKPDVVVKDGNNVIPAGEYTVSYSNNINVGTTAKVTITDVAGGNYTVSGSRNFTITAGAASLINAPQPINRTYDGSAQPLVTAGSAVNGKVVYSLTQRSGYSTSIPVKTDAGTYTVYYKVQGENGAADTTENFVTVAIARQPITPTVLLNNQSTYSTPYTGSAIIPSVTVIAEGKPLTQNVDYTALYSNNINVGTATVTVQSIDGNYQFYMPVTFEITKGKATFAREPQAKTDLYYIGEPQELVDMGYANNGGIVLYSLDNVAYSTAIPTGTARGSYVVFAKVQGSETYAESDLVIRDVKIDKNEVAAPQIALSAQNFPYTGSEQKPTVTVWDDEDNEIDSSEYTVRYSNNVSVGTATVTVTCKKSGNYSFDPITENFQIVDATQTPLTITGKQDAVYYGDTLSLGATGGGSGTVTWSSSDEGVAAIDGSGVVSIKKSGNVTITATKGSSTDTWTFYAKPKPVTATVYAANKVYDNSTAVTLTVTLSGLLPSNSVHLTATGNFIDEKAGTNKIVLITGLNGLEGIKDQYTVTYNNTTTASITPKPASVTTAPVLAGSLTYSGGAQPLLTSGGTAEGGNLMYSLDGREYSYKIPTGTDADTYTVWYKVEASDENHKDSAPVKLGDVTISADPNAPKVRCNPSSFPYDGTERTPTVIVLDSTEQHIIPDSEYTVVFPANAIDKGSYTVTVKDKTGGNYQFSDVTGSFEIVASSQAPVSITDKPAHVYYGDTFYLSATGGSGSGAIQWSIAENSIATINDSGAVTVTGTGSFTVKAYRAASGGYSQSNTDSVTFVAQPKPVTPVVTASDKSYDGNTTVTTLTAKLRDSDKVNSTDEINLTVSGVFASEDAGVGKRVDLTTHTVSGADAAKYTINWPDYVTATINRVDAKIAAVPTAVPNLVANGTPQALVSAGTTENSIGTVVYSLNDQNGAYSADIPKATAVGTYTVWYKVADSVNYNGIPAASVQAEIKAADTPDSGTNNIPTPPVSEPLKTTVQNGTANTVLSATGGNQLVQQAVAAQSRNIVIQPEITGEVTKTAVAIPASTVNQISSQTGAALTVASPIADVTIPNGALDTLGGAGGTVNVVTEQVDGAVALTLTAGGKTVDSVPGGVTLAVPAEDAAPGTVAVLVNEDGSRETIQKSVVKDGVLNIPLDGSATVEIVDNSKDFDDVSPTDWEADAVAFASAHELFSGTSDTTFSPDEEMSRGMLATVLYRLEGLPDQDTAILFEDVDSNAWYTDGIVWAAENGIVNGYGERQFGPNDSITREQFAVMLWRYAGSPETNSDQALAFTDADQASGYAQQALRWAVATGIMGGYPNGRLDPGGTATRAQAAQMLKNFMERA